MCFFGRYIVNIRFRNPPFCRIAWKMFKDVKVAYDGFVFSRVPATTISNKMLYAL